MGDPLYCIIETDSKGKVVIARADMLPGTQFFEDAAPLLVFAPMDDGICDSAYGAFNVLTVEQKKRFLSLSGQNHGLDLDFIRTKARSAVLKHKNEQKARRLTPIEIETYVTVSSIVIPNQITVDGYIAIYEHLPKMRHSCLPNCCMYFDSEGKSSVCTILPIDAGEELTIEYDAKLRNKPIYERRQEYLHMKQFTCHCPRCDAEADDTREFDCFDPQCPGSCFACQPLSKEWLGLPGLHYTGVEYVEPHLLPCTVCHRAPPLQYQEDMFALERKLLKVTERLHRVGPGTAHDTDYSVYRKKWLMLDALQLPKRHRLSVPLRAMRTLCCGALTQDILQHRIPLPFPARINNIPAMEAVDRDLVAAVLHHNRFPNTADADTLMDTGVSTGFSPGYSKTFALDTCQKALRMYLMVHGRDCELPKKFNDIMTQVLRMAPPQPATTAQCMFCGESPLRAALTLSRCGRCKQVAYCSAGCQHAHWPLHLQCCKPA